MERISKLDPAERELLPSGDHFCGRGSRHPVRASIALLRREVRIGNTKEDGKNYQAKTGCRPPGAELTAASEVLLHLPTLKCFREPLGPKHQQQRYEVSEAAARYVVRHHHQQPCDN